MKKMRPASNIAAFTAVASQSGFYSLLVNIWTISAFFESILYGKIIFIFYEKFQKLIAK